ncbi:tetratricopeptide repeat-containing sensor histidine kinase [Flavobacterium urocaniciphilum]|uniref:histidine kinase n=1 Tax=Flavobacterium urocaniciphilum TaxID=1299341 RepID=A0A1H9AFH6_9FLAO|nr:HAMP domain-containing sensor histidine kinase [Flavobacterium urocaniciphilum]SEP75271.1 Histidine kinase-, DNA gyrase B-, and HSP90-like ATPase [Flavobacterium urocaniciphilum]
MRLIGLLLLLFSINTWGQNESLDILVNQCEKSINEEKYKKLIQIATVGIAKSNNNLYLSKFNFYKGYGYEYDNNQYNLAIPYFEKSLKIAQNGKFEKEETLALMRLNYLYYSTKQFDKREELVNYIKKVVDTTSNVNTKGILYGSLGEYHLDKSEISKFIDYKLKAIEYRKLFKKSDTKNTVNIGISYSQIGQAYFKMKQYKKGLEYLNLAKPYLQTSSNALAYLHNDFAKCYWGLQNLDSIQFHRKKIYNLVSKEDSLFICISSANRYLAEYYIDKKELNTAISYLREAEIYGKKSQDLEIMMEVNLTRGKILFEQKKYTEAIKVLKEAATHAYQFDKNSFIVINKLIGNSYKALNNWQEAFRYFEIYNKVNEEVLLESTKENIANAEAKFQNKYKQEKIDVLSTENKLKNVEIANSRKQKIYLFTGFILLLAIAFLLFKQSNNQKKSNKKLQVLNQELDEANKVKLQFFNILNHDLRSPVASLIHFLHLQKENPELLDEESKKRLEQKTISGVENLLQSMEDILLWSKGQMENFKPVPEKIEINELFSDIKNHFSSVENITISLNNTSNFEVTTDKNYLKTILRNITGNAIKALEKTDNGEIIWNAWCENNHSFISISDNGKGASINQFKALFDEKEVVGIKSGLGLHLIRDLAKTIDCEIEVESKENIGTTILLKL